MNNNITESCASYEVAQLLKAKGYKVSGYKYWHKAVSKRTKPYISKGVEYDSDADCEADWNTIVPYPNDEKYVLCSAPTHALAIEWIRVNFGMYPYALYMFAKYKPAVAMNYNQLTAEQTRKYMEWINEDIELTTPSEATEAALLYTLTHLIP